MDFSGKQRLMALIGFALTVAASSAYAGCSATEASITSCAPPPPHGCAIAPSIPCGEGAPAYDPSSLTMLYRFYTEMDNDIASNQDVVPHSPSNNVYAVCESDFSTRFSYAMNEIVGYLPTRGDLGGAFNYIQVVVTYPNGQHELWRVSNITGGVASQTVDALNYYWGANAYVGANSAGPFYLSRAPALNDLAPTCGY